MPKQPVFVGESVLRNYEFLNRMARARSRSGLAQLIASATHDQLQAIIEVCAHVLSGDFKLNVRQKKRLQPYASYVRRLRRVRGELGARRVIQEGSGLIVGGGRPKSRRRQQRGGFGFLASLLLPVLAEAASSLLFSK